MLIKAAAADLASLAAGYLPALFHGLGIACGASNGWAGMENPQRGNIQRSRVGRRQHHTSVQMYAPQYGTLHVFAAVAMVLDDAAAAEDETADINDSVFASCIVCRQWQPIMPYIK